MSGSRRPILTKNSILSIPLCWTPPDKSAELPLCVSQPKPALEVIRFNPTDLTAISAVSSLTTHIWYPMQQRVHAPDDRDNTETKPPTDVLSEFPPSAKLVVKTFEYNNDALTQGGLAEKTLLPVRTVRYALTQLEDHDLVNSRFSFTDARKRCYSLSSTIVSLANYCTYSSGIHQITTRGLNILRSNSPRSCSSSSR
ncbi:hypothetical protein SAMN05421858_4313 [Haladaptatus litoreus]|uniref:Uncharacterized protein n=1 Tax=Haladaptatus litoreus TaxID=553468 RepID=A0A1N7EJY7_9EURY|nr:hypothetical protein SAMN05421858_4313 [Haladaptatus litoreus]